MPCLPRMVSLIGMACSWWGIPFCANVISAWLCALVAGVDVDAVDGPPELVPLVADLLPELLHAVMVTRAASAPAPMISTDCLITSSPSDMPPLPPTPTFELYILCRYVGHRWLRAGGLRPAKEMQCSHCSRWRRHSPVLMGRLMTWIMMRGHGRTHQTINPGNQQIVCWPGMPANISGSSSGRARCTVRQVRHAAAGDTHSSRGVRTQPDLRGAVGIGDD